MSQPTPYVRYQDFSDYQTANPDTPFPGSIIDTELDRLKVTTDEIIANMALTQRDDGLLANGSVHPDALSAAVLDMISGWNPMGDWATATAYVNSSTQKDVVAEAGVSYVCLVSHTSGTFATDLAAGKWQALGQATDAANITFTPTGGIAAVTVAAALAELDTEKQPKDATLTALAAGATASNKLFYWSGVDTLSVADLTAAGRALIDDADAAAMRTTLGLGSLAIKSAVAAGDFAANAVATADIADDQVTLAKWAHGTQGGLPYYGASGAPAELAAGTAGKYLQSGGAGANPAWAYGPLIQVAADVEDAVQTGTTAVPLDDTPPTSSEGDQYLSVTLTPKSATNVLEVEVHIFCSHSATTVVTAALFQDGTVVAATSQNIVAGNVMTLTLFRRLLTGTTSPTTFTVRVGGSTGATLTLNGAAGARLLGGVGMSWLNVREISV